MRELILNLKPKKVLEWGSGFSSLYFPSFLDEKSSWLSIESNEDWARSISEMNNNRSVEIKRASQESYVDEANSQGQFDLIIIDGLFRQLCLERSGRLLSERSFVFIHDANRKEYHSHLDRFQHQWILTDYRRSAGGVAILSNSFPIESILNTRYHERNWAFIQNRVAKILAI